MGQLIPSVSSLNTFTLCLCFSGLGRLDAVTSIGASGLYDMKKIGEWATQSRLDPQRPQKCFYHATAKSGWHNTELFKHLNDPVEFKFLIFVTLFLLFTRWPKVERWQLRSTSDSSSSRRSLTLWLMKSWRVQNDFACSGSGTKKSQSFEITNVFLVWRGRSLIKCSRSAFQIFTSHGLLLNMAKGGYICSMWGNSFSLVNIIAGSMRRDWRMERLLTPRNIWIHTEL